MTHRIDIETIIAASKVLADFNQMDLLNVTFYEGGYPFHLSPEMKQSLLSNVDFVLTRRWEPKETPDAGTARGSPEEEQGQVHGLQEG